MKRVLPIIIGIGVLLFLLIIGCASVLMLPQKSKDINFAGGKEGKMGWSKYRETAQFKNANKSTLIQAAKAGFGEAGFSLMEVNDEEGIVFGEHGMTLHDWNIVVGVYIKEQGKNASVVVLVEGSKDIGFSGDVTGNAWTGIILNGMRKYVLAETGNIASPVIPSEPRKPPPESQAPIAQVTTPQPPKVVKLSYAGTGFMFGSKDYVITNWHVIRGTKNVKVKFLNGEKINAKLLLKNPQNDIAFLKLERSPELPPSDLKIGDSSKVRLGDKVFTIGYPAHWVMGQNPKYTSGDVNALSGIKDDPTVFQISVQIQPGNSGGPLFNQKGEVIGITQSSLDPKVAVGAFGTLPQNVNYAIKSSYISNLLPMLPETLIASRGISVVPTEPENSLGNFIDKAKNNIVLIEATSK